MTRKPLNIRKQITLTDQELLQIILNKVDRLKFTLDVILQKAIKKEE